MFSYWSNAKLARSAQPVRLEEAIRLTFYEGEYLSRVEENHPLIKEIFNGAGKRPLTLWVDIPYKADDQAQRDRYLLYSCMARLSATRHLLFPALNFSSERDWIAVGEHSRTGVTAQFFLTLKLPQTVGTRVQQPVPSSCGRSNARRLLDGQFALQLLVVPGGIGKGVDVLLRGLQINTVRATLALLGASATLYDLVARLGEASLRGRPYAVSFAVDPGALGRGRTDCLQIVDRPQAVSVSRVDIQRIVKEVAEERQLPQSYFWTADKFDGFRQQLPPPDLFHNVPRI